MRRFAFKFVFVLILVMGCSEDDLELPENQNLDDPGRLIQANLLPTLTNFFGRDNGSETYRSASLNGDWVHQYDDEGRLLKSVFSEKYPSRVNKEISYTNYSEDNRVANLEIINYSYFSGRPVTSIQQRTMKLDDNFRLISLVDEDGTSQTFDEHTENGWATDVGHVISNGRKLWTTHYEYDDFGNVTRYTSTYHEYHIQDAAVDYTYTDFGDPRSYDFWNESGAYSNVEYFYREDQSLERLEEKFKRGQDESGTKVYHYNEEEFFTLKETNYDDGRKILVSYDHNDGIITEEYFDQNNLISEVYERMLLTQYDRYFLSTHKIYSEGLISRIKYYAINGYIIREEFYDENGMLDYTEYYDENGNYSHTEDA